MHIFDNLDEKRHAFVNKRPANTDKKITLCLDGSYSTKRAKQTGLKEAHSRPTNCQI